MSNINHCDLVYQRKCRQLYLYGLQNPDNIIEYRTGKINNEFLNSKSNSGEGGNVALSEMNIKKSMIHAAVDIAFETVISGLTAVDQLLVEEELTSVTNKFLDHNTINIQSSSFFENLLDYIIVHARTSSIRAVKPDNQQIEILTKLNTAWVNKNINLTNITLTNITQNTNINNNTNITNITYNKYRTTKSENTNSNIAFNDYNEQLKQKFIKCSQNYSNESTQKAFQEYNRNSKTKQHIKDIANYSNETTKILFEEARQYWENKEKK